MVPTDEKQAFTVVAGLDRRSAAAWLQTAGTGIAAVADSVRLMRPAGSIVLT